MKYELEAEDALLYNCDMKFIKGQTPWNKGKPVSEETREKLRRLRIGKSPWNKGKEFLQVKGDKNPNWKGDKAGYGALHSWIVRVKGRAIYCVECKRQDENVEYEWANISGKYLRDMNDFRSLCVPCHRRETYLRGENKFYYKGVHPPLHKEECKCFRCTGTAWNKGLKGKSKQIPWNKGKKTGLVPKTAFKKGVAPKGSVLFKKGQIPWNKGLKKH